MKNVNRILRLLGAMALFIVMFLINGNLIISISAAMSAFWFFESLSNE